MAKHAGGTDLAQLGNGMKRRESGMYTEGDGVRILIGGEENQGAYHR